MQKQDFTIMLMFDILKISREQFMTNLSKDHLMPSQVGTLFYLHCHGILTQNELASQVNVKPSSMSIAIKKLEELGFIIKNMDEDDQRKTNIEISDSGKACVEDIINVTKKMEEVWFRNMEDEEVKMLKKLFIKMFNNLEDYKKGKNNND